MQVMRADTVIIHRQPYYDHAEDGSGCGGILPTGMSMTYCDQANPDTPVWEDAAVWSKMKLLHWNDLTAKQYYLFQIHTADGTTVDNFSMTRDFPAIYKAISNEGDSWNFDAPTIFKQSWECYQSSGQAYDMSSNIWPQLMSVNGINIDINDIDHIPCLYNFPIVSFSEGPRNDFADQAVDNIAGNGPSGFTAAGVIKKRDRSSWKDSNDPDAETWRVVTDSDYCHTFYSVFGFSSADQDDQYLADSWGQMKALPSNSPALPYLQRWNRIICEQDQDDSIVSFAEGFLNMIVGTLSFAAGNVICPVICGVSFLSPFSFDSP